MCKGKKLTCESWDSYLMHMKTWTLGGKSRKSFKSRVLMIKGSILIYNQYEVTEERGVEVFEG